jgi:hypothetical protein
MGQTTSLMFSITTYLLMLIRSGLIHTSTLASMPQCHGLQHRTRPAARMRYRNELLRLDR